jgi:16S rRNA A1518/A1519 N6-dimethyltransferase RsmA/KsgA/DIM1 with predicted DNA glycosylase/AP lyase activity
MTCHSIADVLQTAQRAVTLSVLKYIFRAAVGLQEEVAQRLVDATPGRPDYRAMNIITHYYSKPVYRFM